MRVMYSARHIRDEFRRLSDRQRRTPDYFVKLTALDELHAEVAGAIALADVVDRDDARIIKTCSGFCFPAKALQVVFARPLTQRDHLQRDDAIEIFLPGTVHHALAAPTDFFQ